MLVLGASAGVPQTGTRSTQDVLRSTIHFSSRHVIRSRTARRDITYICHTPPCELPGAIEGSSRVWFTGKTPAAGASSAVAPALIPDAAAASAAAVGAVAPTNGTVGGDGGSSHGCVARGGCFRPQRNNLGGGVGGWGIG